MAFLALFGLVPFVQALFFGQAFWMAASPEYWIYPLQVFVPGALLLFYRRHYTHLQPNRPSWSLAIGLIALGVWISPQWLLGSAPRATGFDPEHLGPGAPYIITLTLRLLRAVIVVPFVEEIFWRGFLLRFLVNPDFQKVPFGTRTLFSFAAVTLGFTLEHQPIDYIPAAVTGALYNLVAYRTASLGSCILAHAVTNLGLCLYVLGTRQWGFW